MSLQIGVIDLSIEKTNYEVCRLLWRPRIPLLTRGTTFRFPSQRVLREIESNPSVEEPREVSIFLRSNEFKCRNIIRPEWLGPRSWMLKFYLLVTILCSELQRVFASRLSHSRESINSLDLTINRQTSVQTSFLGKSSWETLYPF